MHQWRANRHYFTLIVFMVGVVFLLTTVAWHKQCNVNRRAILIAVRLFSFSPRGNIKLKLLFSMVLAFILLGCSGSSTDSNAASAQPLLIVNAGSPQTANEGMTVSLNGDALGQTAELTYAWSVTPTIAILHEDTAFPLASFIAPATVDGLSYVFTLQVTDGAGNTGSDTVQVNIAPVNALPVAQITFEQPSDLPYKVFQGGIEVVLDGSTSSDTDADDPAAPIARYQWQQLAGQDVLQGVNNQGQYLAFVTPILDADSMYTFALTVTDFEGAQHSEQLSINVLSASHTLPTVDAGVDHQVFSGESILLTGVADSSIAAAKPLGYLWLNSPPLQPLIDNENALQTFAVAPQVTTAQDIRFTLRVTDGNNNVVDDSITVNVRPFVTSLINDTGVTLQASLAEVNNLHQGLYPGQDGQRGQDSVAKNGLLAKAGRGAGGFDFTRLDDMGDEVDDITQPWGCVRDNVTGLVWESKTTDGDLHGQRHTYSWFSEVANGGYSGALNPSFPSCTLANCNTQEFADAVNVQGLCGFYDWQLPSHEQLLSIVHFGITGQPMLDSSYFPNTDNTLTEQYWYWTRQASVDGTNEVAQNAWAIDFATGNDNFLNKSRAVSVRLVRAGR
ncbi:MAG: chitinase [Paraglaciecola sp.]|jgi:chitinase